MLAYQYICNEPTNSDGIAQLYFIYLEILNIMRSTARVMTVPGYAVSDHMI